MNLSALTLIIFLLSFDAMALFGESVKSQINLSDKDEFTRGCQDADVICYDYADRVIFKKSCGEPPITLEVGLLEKKVGQLEKLCIEASKNLILKNIKDADFDGAYRDIAVIQGFPSAPGSGVLFLYSLRDGKMKATLNFNDQPIEFNGKKLKYLKTKEFLLIDVKKPKRWKELGCNDSWWEDGLGCKLMQETEIDLATFKEKTLKKTKLGPVQ